MVSYQVTNVVCVENNKKEIAVKVRQVRLIYFLILFSGDSLVRSKLKKLFKIIPLLY